MSRFVVCPATVLHVLEGGGTLPPGRQLLGPGSLRSQVLELLLRRVNAGILAEEQALDLHERLTALKLRLLNDRVSRRVAWDLARSQGWDSLRDAEYLAITKLQADALVTVDERLAACANGIVPVATVDVLTHG